MNIMRLGGLVTLVGIGALILILKRRGSKGERAMKAARAAARLNQGGTA
jgi:hypothetical protein